MFFYGIEADQSWRKIKIFLDEAAGLAASHCIKTRVDVNRLRSTESHVGDAGRPVRTWISKQTIPCMHAC